MRTLILFALLLSSCASFRHEGRVRELGPGLKQSDPLERTAVLPLSDAVPSPIHEQSDRTEPEASLYVVVGLPPRAVSPVARPLPTSADVTPVAVDPQVKQEENLMPRKKWNKLAIPAFLAALGTVYLGLFTSGVYAVIGALLVTLVLAGFSLRTIRKQEQAGKGFAFAALMIGVIAALVTALTIAYYGIE